MNLLLISYIVLFGHVFIIATQKRKMLENALTLDPLFNLLAVNRRPKGKHPISGCVFSLETHPTPFKPDTPNLPSLGSTLSTGHFCQSCMRLLRLCSRFRSPSFCEVKQCIPTGQAQGMNRAGRVVRSWNTLVFDASWLLETFHGVGWIVSRIFGRLIRASPFCRQHEACRKSLTAASASTMPGRHQSSLNHGISNIQRTLVPHSATKRKINSRFGMLGYLRQTYSDKNPGAQNERQWAE